MTGIPTVPRPTTPRARSRPGHPARPRAARAAAVLAVVAGGVLLAGCRSTGPVPAAPPAAGSVAALSQLVATITAGQPGTQVDNRIPNAYATHAKTVWLHPGVPMDVEVYATSDALNTYLDRWPGPNTVGTFYLDNGPTWTAQTPDLDDAERISQSDGVDFNRATRDRERP